MNCVYYKSSTTGKIIDNSVDLILFAPYSTLKITQGWLSIRKTFPFKEADLGSYKTYQNI